MCDLYSDIRKNADWYADLGSGKIVILLLLLNQKQPAKRKIKKHVNKYDKYKLKHEGIVGHFDHKIWWKLVLCRVCTLIKILWIQILRSSFEISTHMGGICLCLSCNFVEQENPYFCIVQFSSLLCSWGFLNAQHTHHQLLQLFRYGFPDYKQQYPLVLDRTLIWHKSRIHKMLMHKDSDFRDDIDSN